MLRAVLLLALLWVGAADDSLPPPPGRRLMGAHDTEITGLRLEDVVGGINDIMTSAARALHSSDIPLAELFKIKEEIQKGVDGGGAPAKRWLESGDLAKLSGLKYEPYVTVPVDLNLIFVGFSGDGHYKLDLSQEDLRPWFEHMEHKMPHTLVPAYPEEGALPTKNTHVYYRYNFHVLELHPDVDAILEAVIWDNSRPVDPWGEEEIKWTSQDMHQTDIVPMMNAVDDLVSTLRLNSSYTLFMINPKLPYPDFNYGYRYGFSAQELKKLYQNDKLLDDLQTRGPSRPHLKMSEALKQDVHTLHGEVIKAKGGVPDDESAAKLRAEREKLERLVEAKSREAPDHKGPPGADPIGRKERGEKPLPRGRPKYKDMRDLSQAWAAIYKQALHDLSYWQRHPAEELEENGEWEDGAEAEAAYGQELKTILGRQKDQSLPRDMLFEVMAGRLMQSNSPEDKEYLRGALEDAHAQEDCLVDTWVGNGRFAVIDFSAGPFEWGPIVGGKGVRSYRTIPDIEALQNAATDFTMGGSWSDPEFVNRVGTDLREHGLERLEKEKELILVFLRNHCEGQGGGGDAASTCGEMRNKLSAVVAFMNEHTKKRLDETDDETLKQLSFVTGGPHEGANVSLVQRSMFAKLGALIETTQRQLITPSASASPAPYRSQVFFHVYVISNHDTYKPTAKKHFDFGKFKEEMEAFRLPRQQYHYVLHKYSMADDQALAVAYANALRSSVVATLKVDGRFVATKRMFLDSQVLQKHLQLLHSHLVAMDGGDGERGEADVVDRRDIPIFLFSMDFPLPVFIDKHYQARALEDMVIAVQSDEKLWESHLSCNGSPILWNLRNPLRPILTATAHHLAGVLPMHITYDQSYKKISQDWLWSVGCSPMAHTSTHIANFSAIHVDTAHRNFVVDSLTESLKLLNEGLAAMGKASLNRDNLHVSKAVPVDKLVSMHVAVKLSWRKCLMAVHRLDFQEAIPHVHTAVRNARHFRDLAVHSQKLLQLSGCMHTASSQPFDWWMVIFVGAAVLSVATYYLLHKEKVKPKLN